MDNLTSLSPSKKNTNRGHGFLSSLIPSAYLYLMFPPPLPSLHLLQEEEPGFQARDAEHHPVKLQLIALRNPEKKTSQIRLLIMKRISIPLLPNNPTVAFAMDLGVFQPSSCVSPSANLNKNFTFGNSQPSIPLKSSLNC